MRIRDLLLELLAAVLFVLTVCAVSLLFYGISAPAESFPISGVFHD